jgi:type II secretory pathway component GspD/PulD (secretin)
MEGFIMRRASSVNLLAACLTALVLTSGVQAQSRGRTARATPRTITLPSVSPAAQALPTTTTINIQTTVAGPDGGTVILGGYSDAAEARHEFGVPGLGQLPIVGRGFRNVGYGRRTSSVRVTASWRIIDLEEEEVRQTGEKSR